VAVGSDNPVKVEAVRRAFNRFFDEVKVIGVKVESGVPPQPINGDVIQGAKNRASKALALTKADYAVGIEGGVFGILGSYYCAAYVYILDEKGRGTSGMTGWFECPRRIVHRLLMGEELGFLMQDITGIEDIKRGIGAVGYLTRGVITRTDFYEHAVIMALTSVLGGD